MKPCYACEDTLPVYATVDDEPWCRECFEAAVMLGDIELPEENKESDEQADG